MRSRLNDTMDGINAEFPFLQWYILGVFLKLDSKYTVWYNFRV